MGAPLSGSCSMNDEVWVEVGAATVSCPSESCSPIHSAVCLLPGGYKAEDNGRAGFGAGHPARMVLWSPSWLSPDKIESGGWEGSGRSGATAGRFKWVTRKRLAMDERWGDLDSLERRCSPVISLHRTGIIGGWTLVIYSVLDAR